MQCRTYWTENKEKNNKIQNILFYYLYAHDSTEIDDALFNNCLLFVSV